MTPTVPANTTSHCTKSVITQATIKMISHARHFESIFIPIIKEPPLQKKHDLLKNTIKLVGLWKPRVNCVSKNAVC